ncbi:hypothetical protein JCM6294_1578 [Bacteroides pyogenes DSM 20611 = JCM 6294]|uniref:Uncharacterized protein n=1 Tax=Bacteroides pyogenes DSM 20611 = JCM 6294 TaxID=1121100 RepID=W4PHM3_9BACE|nr:hypothetical protein JCM6294_1578 [Bacteroides pyogenes DSM 20611 = JCM 6294]
MIYFHFFKRILVKIYACKGVVIRFAVKRQKTSRSTSGRLARQRFSHLVVGTPLFFAIADTIKQSC